MSCFDSTYESKSFFGLDYFDVINDNVIKVY